MHRLLNFKVHRDLNRLKFKGECIITCSLERQSHFWRPFYSKIKSFPILLTFQTQNLINKSNQIKSHFSTFQTHSWWTPDFYIKKLRNIYKYKATKIWKTIWYFIPQLFNYEIAAIILKLEASRTNEHKQIKKTFKQVSLIMVTRNSPNSNGSS